jgi:hypothetical protein
MAERPQRALTVSRHEAASRSAVAARLAHNFVRINETHRVIVSDIIIKPLRALDLFVALSALDVARSGRKLRDRNQSNECPDS